MSELDPRDAILQAHTPVVVVPRFGALAPMEKTGHRYLVAEDGIWLEVKRPWLDARVPIATIWNGEDEAAWDHSLPFGPVERRIAYAISNTEFDRIQQRFLIDARAALPNEFAAWAVYDEATQALHYQPLVAIEAGPGGIEFHRPTLGLGHHLAIDLHSHGAMDAFFSSTDDEDDRGDVKVAVVAGRLDREPMWTTRLCVLGVFIGPESANGDPAEPAAPQRCRVCGCTDERACPGGCEWVEPDLCSRCA